jgi:hypothetical protein
MQAWNIGSGHGGTDWTARKAHRIKACGGDFVPGNPGGGFENRQDVATAPRDFPEAMAVPVAAAAKTPARSIAAHFMRHINFAL